MLSQTIDSLKSQIDTVYVVSNDTEILKELINSQNYIYGVIILILLFIIGFNFWTNQKKIKSELESNLRNSLADNVKRIKEELNKNIDVSIKIKESQLNKSINSNAGESFRGMAYFLAEQEKFGSAISWEVEAIKNYQKSDTKLGLKFAVRNLIEYLEKGISSDSKKNLYEQITATEEMLETKKIINILDDHFFDDKKRILKYLDQIESGKDDDSVPVNK